MMARFFCKALISVWLVGSTATASSSSFTLRAAPGEFNARTLGAPSAETRVQGSLRILAFTPHTAWPPAAYMGVQQGPNRNNSLQVLAIRNRMSDGYLVVGYRLVVDGKEVQVASLEDVPLRSAVRVGVAFKDGIATVRVNAGKEIEVRTPFREVVPYVSVSSAEAEFTVEP